MLQTQWGALWPDNEFAQFTDATTPGTYSQSISPGGTGAVYPIASAINSDSIDHHVKVSGNSNDFTIIGEVLIPAGAGYGGVPPVDIIAALLNTNTAYFSIQGGGAIWLNLKEALNTGKTINFYFQGGLH